MRGRFDLLKVTIFAGASALALLSSPQNAYAQATSANISGTVKDTTGAVLPGVTVTAVNTGTGIARTGIADDEGRYSLLNLSLGPYEVRAELTGFREAVRGGITLTIGREAVVNFVLDIGQVTDQITVSGEAALIETADAQLGGQVSAQQIADLPLNARSFMDLALFQTGVKISRGNGVGGDRATGTFGTMMTISGARPEQSTFQMDGTDISDMYQRGTGSVSHSALGVEAVREFEVLTHNYGAEQGKFSGGVVNVVTRSGTNRWDGSVFHYYRNDRLDTRNFFDKEKPDFNRNQFGFSLGGPIVRNRTFIFGNYEGLRDRLGRTEISRVPTAAAREGLIQNPTTRAFTQIRVNPAVLPWLNLYPLPSPGARDFFDGTAEFITTRPTPTDQDYVSVRVDHQFSQANSFFTRVTATNGSVVSGAPPNALWGTDLFNKNRYLTIEDRHVFGSNLLMTFRSGYNRTELSDVPILLDPTGNAPGLVLVTGQNPATVNINGVTSPSVPNDTTAQQVRNLFDASYDVQYAIGQHRFKMGTRVQRETNPITFRTRMNSRWDFPSLRSFLQGTDVTRMQMAPPEVSDPDKTFQQWYGGFYVQDDIRVGSGLTLNLGLRTEFTTAVSDSAGRMSYLPREKFASGGITDLVVGEKWYNSPGMHWAPRLGFAWDARGTGRSVLRGGAGVYYDHIMPFWHMVGGWRQPPFNNVVDVRTFPNGTPLTFPLTSSEVLAIFSPVGRQIWQFQVDPDKILTRHYNLNWQQQLADMWAVKIGYVGTRGTNLGALTSYNVAQPIGFFADGRPDFGPPPHVPPNSFFGLVDSMDTSGESYYHGMELELRKRFSGGLQLQSSYTFSKMIDTASSIRTGQGDPEGNRRGDFDDLMLRGLSPMDVRHNFTFNVTYDLPSLMNSSGIVRTLLGGWQVNSLLMLATGIPFTVTQQAANGDLKGINRPDLVPGRTMGDDLTLGGPDAYFDTTAFAFSNPRAFGNVGRNTLVGPGLSTLDGSLNKWFRIPRVADDFKIQFRSEFFNILNTPNFARPSSQVFLRNGTLDPAAGRIIQTATSSRQVQFALRVTF